MQDPQQGFALDTMTHAQEAAQAAGEPPCLAPPFQPEPGQRFRFKGSPAVYTRDAAGTVRRADVAEGQAHPGKAARKAAKRARQQARQQARQARGRG